MIILGLGSNIGDREEYLARAVATLSSHVLCGIRLSSIYESEAVLRPEAPQEWNMPYLNMVVTGDTHLSPEALLREVKSIEHHLGRKARGRWGPREIDIDILAYGDEVIQSAELTVPHVDLLKRSFALLPLAEVEPNWQYPGDGAYQGKSAFALAQELNFGVTGKTVLTDIQLQPYLEKVQTAA